MKHIYFSGIGGAGLGPLAEIAQDAGYKVSGSDIRESLVSKELERRDIDVVYQQDKESIEAENITDPIDWLVYTSSLADNHPELEFARENGIKISKRDEFLSEFIKENNLDLIAIAGTHGKTTTTGMLIWACNELNLPVSYSIGTTILFGPSGKYDKNSKYFVYEADEYDRNFLKFYPKISVLPSVDYDHADIYKTKEDYKSAFRQFINQSELTIMFKDTHDYLQPLEDENLLVFDHETSINEINLAGQIRRDDAYLVKQVLLQISDVSEDIINEVLSKFPGTNRRFEELASNLYTDYAHHPAEIKATIDIAKELNDNVVIIYQPHQNERQLKMIDEYKDIFNGVKQLYWLPTFMPAGDREKSDKILQPEDFLKILKNISAKPAEMNDDLWDAIEVHLASGDIVIAMSAGTLDAWLREKLSLI
ncbi:Mur ligase domain-containing protein [Ruminococcaceae bacterium OttesenSCG-928-A11]|nr:Mur ligase domain-containing protein [Ruminococcaceae bacterium OttesenSCG-928-A11]